MARTRPKLSPLSQLHHWLEGRPMGLPLHPLFVHLPIGLFTLSFLFDAASRVLKPENWVVVAAFYTLAAGLVTAIVAALFGVVDWVDIRADHPGRKTATTHMLLNLAAMAVYLVNGWLRLDQLDAPQTPFLPLALSFVSMGILYISGYLGGRLVYDEGIGVGRHRRPSDLPEKTIHAPAASRPGEFVPVASTQLLDQHETLRVECNGYVMALARVGDKYYAVQEFCTHRYGPMSEGRLSDAELECPWHGSRFDVRTGKVIDGPAKVDLKTFETRVVDGVIQVRAPAEPPSHTQAVKKEEAKGKREGKAHMAGRPG